MDLYNTDHYMRGAIAIKKTLLFLTTLSMIVLFCSCTGDRDGDSSAASGEAAASSQSEAAAPDPGDSVWDSEPESNSPPSESTPQSEPESEPDLTADDPPADPQAEPDPAESWIDEGIDGEEALKEFENAEAIEEPVGW